MLDMTLFGKYSDSHSPTIVLEGGLGNRMRVAAAAYTMSERTGLPMRVLWVAQWGMPCRFDNLFSPCCQAATGFTLRDAEGMERWLYARSRPANLYIPRIVQKLRFSNIIRSPQIYHLNQAGFDYETWFRRGSNLMFAYRHFCEWTPELLSMLFIPLPCISSAADSLCEPFTSHTIGCHIRRTDNRQSIEESPTELFIETLDRECDSHSDIRIFLATDDEPTKQLLLQRYGASRLIVHHHHATRNNADGIRDALTEMIALSRTSCIYGTAGSTFSEIAALWGSIPRHVLTL